MDRVIIHVSGSSVSGDILQWFCCDSSLPLNPSDCFEFLGSEPFPCGHPPPTGAPPPPLGRAFPQRPILLTQGSTGSLLEILFTSPVLSSFLSFFISGCADL